MDETRSTPTYQIKLASHQLIDSLPESSLDMAELAYHFYACEQIERGLRDCEAGRTVTTEQLRENLRNMPRRTKREEAHDLIDSLPSDCSWPEVAYEFHRVARLHQGVEQDIADMADRDDEGESP